MLRNAFCVFVACAWICVLMPLVLLSMLFRWDTGASIWIARKLWSPVLLWAGGAQLEVSGAENIDTSRPGIFAANHQSTIDIPALFMALPLNLRFVAKKQLQYVPVLGWYMTLAKFVFIDRSRSGKAIPSLDAAARLIRSGVSIIMFAEGTRSEDGSILPFKKGPFALALKAGVPVYPVTIEGSGKLMPKNSWVITPGPIRVVIGKPLDASLYGESERERLLRDVRAVMIAQSLALGGKGGDAEDAVALQGVEGMGRGPASRSRQRAESSSDSTSPVQGRTARQWAAP